MADFFGANDLSVKSALIGPKLSGLAGGSHHRALFNHHWNGVDLLVNQKVRGNGKRQVVVGQGVFDKLIVQPLNRGVVVVIGLEHLKGLCGVTGKGFSYPLGLFCLSFL